MPSASLQLYDYTRPQLTELLASWGFHALHAARLFGYLHREGVIDLATMTELPAKLRAKLLAETVISPLVACVETDSTDGCTRKYLLGLHDGERIETVLMRFRGRVTACVSSQAGCALGCVFCATGQRGFTRNLSTGEIVAQALYVHRVLLDARRNGGERTLSSFSADEGESLRNIVMMGMGEPLHNYDSVMDALDILREPAGLSISTKRITLSTVGVVPGIIRLADEGRPYSLAVSLHAATQAERAAIVPSALAWPLDELLDACRYYTAKLDRKIFFEWTLIENQNDSAEQAHALGYLLRGLPSQVNLIPLNPTAGYSGTPGRHESAARFQAILQEFGLPATIRQRRGIDIAAGCGQLVGDATNGK